MDFQPKCSFDGHFQINQNNNQKIERFIKIESGHTDGNVIESGPFQTSSGSVVF